MRCASPSFTGMSSSVLPAACRDDDIPALTVLPPVQSLDRVAAARHVETADDDVARHPPSCDDDDSVPPIVRFKNRYRRELRQEVEQQRQCGDDVARDWNHNETSKLLLLQPIKKSCSPPPPDDRYCVEYVSSSTDVPPRLAERRFVADETRAAACEKRTWSSRVTPEVDCSDPWMSASKISCRDVALDSTAAAGVRGRSEQPISSNILPKRYHETRHRSSEYLTRVLKYREPKCEPDLLLLFSYFHCIICIRSSLQYSSEARIQKLRENCCSIDAEKNKLLF